MIDKLGLSPSCWWHHTFLREHTVMDTYHHGRWTQIFGCEASEPETSWPVEKRNFYLPHLHLAPSRGDLIRISKRSFPSCGYHVALFLQILRLAILIQYWLVRDRQTDGRTHDDSKYGTSTASHGQKYTQSLTNETLPSNTKMTLLSFLFVGRCCHPCWGL